MNMFNTNFAQWQPMMNADTKSADYYIGGQLVAIAPVTTYSSPEGAVKKSFSKGQMLGTIYSYVQKNGNLWWQLSDNSFVKSMSGIFDPDIVEKTAAAARANDSIVALKQSEDEGQIIPESITDAGSKVLKGATDFVTGAGESLGSIGKNLNTIIIVLLVIASLVAVIYAYKTFKS